jgi:uncharacterized protein (DUF362 family)
MFSRRNFISLFFIFLLSWNKSAMAQIFFKPKKKNLPRISENPFTEGGNALVGVAGSGGVQGMIKDAVSLIGGFERLNVKGKRVLIKPNVVSGKPNPATTNPEVVGAVVRLMYEYGAAKVYVGDMSAMATLSTLRNMKNNGIKKAAEDNGAEVVIFEDYDWVEVELPRNQYVKTAYVTEWLYRTDLMINLPVIKTHRSASYSISLKNFIGCTHLKQRPYLIDSDHWEEIVAEFNAVYTPDLNIVDGTVSMIEGGPWEGTPANTNLIIASGDRVAADAVGLGIIKSFGKWNMVTGKDVWEQKQIKTAIEFGIGNAKNNIMFLQGKGDEKFQGLMEKVRENTGL